MALKIYSGRSSCKQTCKLQANKHQDMDSSNNRCNKEDSNNPDRPTNKL